MLNPLETAVDSESSRTIEATVSADLAIMFQLEGSANPVMELVPHSGALPELGFKQINLYVSEISKGQAKDHLVELVRRNYRAPHLALTG